MGNAALVTGGNSGIGLVCARELARAGWHVLIASRNRAASDAAVRDIARSGAKGEVEALDLDLASMASVRGVVGEVIARGLPLHALVCNAGLQFNSGPQLSKDGYELTFAVNHLGHFLLTNLLFGELVKRAPARIVIVASGVHDPALRTGMPKPAIEDLDTLATTGGATKGEFNGRLAYVNSKLCNVWFTYELVRRVGARPVTVNGWEPGLVPASGLARDYPPAMKFIWDRILPFVTGSLNPLIPSLSTLSRSGTALSRMVLDPELANTTGKYFPSHARWHAARSSELSYDAQKARALWDASVRMSGLQPGESTL
jgi:light-dependent protochlorophyllide reductase